MRYFYPFIQSLPLRKIYYGSLLSKNGAFCFGLFGGFTIILMIVIAFLAWNGSANLGNEVFLNRVFPIYRLLAIVFIYILLVGWDVYGWIAYKVNYKYLFQFKHHHSELWQVTHSNIKY